MTPHNNNKDDNNNIINFQTFQKISDNKNNSKNRIKNGTILKNSSSNKILNCDINDITFIYKNKSKKNINKNNHRQNKLKNELTWSKNQLINNSVIPNSPLKMNKLNTKNNNMKNNKKLKSMNITNSSKNYGYAGLNNKRQRNIRTNNIEKIISITNKFSLTSIRRKNTINTYIYNPNNNSPNSNNMK